MSVSCLESERGQGKCVDLHDQGNRNGPSYKSSSSIIGSSYSTELKIFFFVVDVVIMWDE